MESNHRRDLLCQKYPAPLYLPYPMPYSSPGIGRYS